MKWLHLDNIVFVTAQGSHLLPHSLLCKTQQSSPFDNLVNLYFQNKYPGTNFSESAPISQGNPCERVWSLTGGKVAEQKKFNSVYQLTNIQIFWTGQGTSIFIVHIWMWTMDSRFLSGKYLKRLETRNNGWFDLKFSHFEWGPWRSCDAKSQRFGIKSNPN